METRKLAELVSEMRSAQKAYFRTRDSGELERAKALESRVDNACLEALAQPGLFDDQEGADGTQG